MSLRVMPETHGAAGDLSQDDALSVKAACLSAIADGRTVDACGRYLLDSPVDVTVGHGEHLSIQGNGPSNSTFVVNNSTGGLVLGSDTERQQTMHISDMQIKPGLADSGVPLVLARKAGGLDLDRSLTIRNVHIGPENEGAEHDNEDFSEGVSAAGNHRVLVNGFTLSSRAAVSKWDFMLDVSGVYKANLNDLELNVSGAQGSGGGALIGLKSHGTDQEGFVATNSTVNGADIGLSFVRDSREPGFQWTKGHFNSEKTNVFMDGVRDGTMEGVLLFGPQEVAANETFTDIYLVNASEMTFSQLIFRQGARLANGSAAPRRHLVIEPREGGLVEGIDFEIKHMTGSSSIPPIYIGVGPNGEKPKAITIRLPFYAVNRDNANYPAQLVELHPDVDPEEVVITTAAGPVSYDNSAASGPTHLIRRVINAIANGASLGRTLYTGTNSNGDEVAYGRRRAKASKVQSGSERGQIDDFVVIDGIDRKGLKLDRATNVGESIASIGMLEASGYTVRRIKTETISDGNGGTIEVLTLA